MAVIGVALAVFQHFTGINSIIYYAPTLLSSTGLGNSAALLANVVNGAVNVAMTIVAIRLLGRAGRRPLLLGGTTGMVAEMMVVALTFALGGSQLHGGTAYIAIAGPRTSWSRSCYPAERHRQRRHLFPVRRAVHRRAGLLPTAGAGDQGPQRARYRPRAGPAGEPR